ncbi:MAG TPA: hypothetical protein DCP57_04080 [Gammaproteobacteria bacterium]|nr:MAG: histidine phosphatase family protein [OM182 bacterium]HAL41601.1 hypothetical protein [Gammaproteobacteria bacterium]
METLALAELPSDSALRRVQTLYLIRHGETEWNVAGRMQGRLDSPLTAQGEAQALAHGQQLSALGGVDQLWVSSAGRTRATVALINQTVAAPMVFADQLLERDCGTWSGKTMPEIKLFDPSGWASRKDDPFLHRPGGGENLVDLQRRFQALLDMQPVPERLGIVSHGVMTRAILGSCLGLDQDTIATVSHPNRLFYRLVVENGRVSVAYFEADRQHPGGGLAHSGEPVLGLAKSLGAGASPREQPLVGQSE